MDVWMAVARGLTAVDSLHRRWARELGVDGNAVFVLLSLARGAMSCATIAMECGRQRQHVQRTLRTLEADALVEVASRSDDGRVNTWALSESGAEVARRLRLRSQAWERMVDPPIDLRALEHQLARLTQLLVNQPMNNGWAHALSEPFEVRRLCWDSLPMKEAWRSSARPVAEHDLAPRFRDELNEAEATGPEEATGVSPE